MMKNKKSIVAFVLLQIALFIVSLGGICSKKAGKEEFLSIPFIVYYCILIFILFVYAIIWQQVLKRLSLTVAYASKGIGIFYGILWGALVFSEKINVNMIIGAIVVLIGVFINISDELGEKKK